MELKCSKIGARWLQNEATYRLDGSKIRQYGQDSPKRLQDDSKETPRWPKKMA